MLLSIFFATNIGIGAYFVYYKYVNPNKKMFRTYYFYNVITDLINFDAKLLKIDKKSYKNINIYYIGYITNKKIDDCENIKSVNPLYLLIDHASGYTEEKGVNKYLVFDSTDENKEVLKKYTDVWNGIRDKIKEISDNECDYEKDYTKIKFNSDISYH